MSSGTYTCITCRVGFLDGDLQRGHYKTDWHRYNLKRKVADLPPVTADTFQQKVLAQRAKVQEQSKTENVKCDLCSKHFSTQNAYQNHLQSKKHKDAVSKQTEKLKTEIEKKNEESKTTETGLPENEKRLMKDCVNMRLKEKMQTAESDVAMATKGKGATGKTKMEISDDDDSDAESVDSWDENSLGIEECLFCSHINSSMEKNIEHMTVKHSFFLPDAEYITDLEGLICYLGEKIGVGHVCLWCNEKGKTFHSTKAVQKHMLDKGHCKILHEGDTVYEFADFYDYRSSYPDYQEGTEQDSGNDDPERDVEMEDDSDDEVTEQEIKGDGYELVLPSGATIGHRSLMKYYRQNLPNRSYDKTKTILPKMLAQYKALGWTGTTGAVAQRRAKDLGYMQRLKSRKYMDCGH
ncbi:hypothetical protein FSP39_013226 [Pinctada imbricata]|uniref:C2H2-type domain-containing protein n=1 Tax=Pinctada imbricata TaxID=66713 RepID=A0AA88YV54_PINIB|nr:hypothetical protein FSP39_013226 [Pinctada imbricata]